MALQLFLFLFVLTAETGIIAGAVGVNWRTEASHSLPPSKVVELLKSNDIGKVKLFDANPKILQALSQTNIGVTVGIPNSMLKSLNASRKVAESWVHDNVTRYFNAGNRVRIELLNWNLASEVRVVVPSSFDSFFSESGRPSSGHFRADLNKTMIELLSFLTKHHSPFFVTISPFLSFHQNNNISLDFSLFKDTAQAHKDGRKTYINSLYQQDDHMAESCDFAGLGLITNSN